MLKRPTYDLLPIEKIAEISNKIFANHPEIKLGYLYGSYVNGNATIYSDIDIGIVIDSNFSQEPLYGLKIQSELEDFFLTNYCVSIDLRILNESSPIFLNKAVRKGQLIYGSDIHFRTNFELSIMHAYFDIKPFYEESKKKYLKALSND
jgi:predicted nucleotidyltransferase